MRFHRLKIVTQVLLLNLFWTQAMPRSELLANLAAALPAAVEKLPRKWKTVQSVSLKTSASVALPILVLWR